jgi:hypothetical protein
MWCIKQNCKQQKSTIQSETDLTKPLSKSFVYILKTIQYVIQTHKKFTVQLIQMLYIDVHHPCAKLRWTDQFD